MHVHDFEERHPRTSRGNTLFLYIGDLNLGHPGMSSQTQCEQVPGTDHYAAIL